MSIPFLIFSKKSLFHIDTAVKMCYYILVISFSFPIYIISS